MSSQIAAGLDGVDRKLDPGVPDPEPYAAERRMLPTGLDEAVPGSWKRRATSSAPPSGPRFVDFVLAIKRHELGRYQAHVTDWEHREYFEMY